MKKPCRSWDDIPACVREELGIRGRAFYSDRVSSHGRIEFPRPDTLADNRILARQAPLRGWLLSRWPGVLVLPDRRQIWVC